MCITLFKISNKRRFEGIETFPHPNKWTNNYMYKVMKKNEECTKEKTEGKHDMRCRLPAYDISKFTNVFLHHIVHIIVCPFVAMWECFNAFKSAFIRDFK